MKAIIVAGGKGERLKPLTETRPKPMIEVGGKPILEHTINLFKKHGITDFVIALCYLPEVITSYFGNGSAFGVTIEYTYENLTQPRGTAGAIFPAKSLIQDTFIVTYADTLRDLDISALIQAHRDSRSFATLNVYKHTGENFKSSLKFDDQNLLTEFTELPSSQKLEGDFAWSNGSFYVFESEIFDYIPEQSNADFAKDIFPVLLSEHKKISVFPSDGYFIDIGTIETLKKAEVDIQTGAIAI